MNHDEEPLDIATAAGIAQAVLDEVEVAVVGKRDALTLVLAGILAGGHVLLEDLPGLGKTLAARSFAQALGLDFQRPQFTPDLLPADVTGSFLYDQRSQPTSSFRPGPLFTNLLLADEINRTPPKTQAALLEAMQEQQVTVEGETFHLDAPVPRARHRQPDRVRGHLSRCPRPSSTASCCGSRFGYPTRARSGTCCSGGSAAGRRSRRCEPVVDGAALLRHAAGRRGRSTVDATRRPLLRRPRPRPPATHPQVLVGVVAARLARAAAASPGPRPCIAGRDYVTPEDVKAVAVPALAHRITIKPELWMSAATGSSVVADVLASVPTPAALDDPGAPRWPMA